MEQYEYTRFIDETGDLNFFSKGGDFAVGENGISKTFGIGMARLKQDLEETRKHIRSLCLEVEGDSYLNTVPSVRRRMELGGFYFHAKDDVPEIRERFFKFLKSTNFSLEIYIARKILDIFVKKHNKNENEFYADILAHLLKNKMGKYSRLVLNIAQKGSATTELNLELATQKALNRFRKNQPGKNGICSIVYNVQNFSVDPLLSVADYSAWSVQRVFEKGDVRYYNFIQEKIPLIVDLYDVKNYSNWGNYYSPEHPLTSSNKIEIGPSQS
jgi:hypothetical protein